MTIPMLPTDSNSFRTRLNFAWAMCVSLLFLSWLALMSARSAPLPWADTPPQAFAVELTATLDKTRVTPDERVRLTALLTTEDEPQVTRITHQATRLGRYDAAAGQLILHPNPFDQARVDVESLPTDLDGLGGSSLTPMKGLPELRTVRTPREWGVETEFRPRCLGIYSIFAEWTLADGRVIVSPPVVLTVQPPVGHDGKPVIKSEWLQYSGNAAGLGPSLNKSDDRPKTP